MTSKTITLDSPIARGDTSIETLTLTKPGVGALRGVSLSALVTMDVDALITLLPRITTPSLTKPEVMALDIADLVAIGDAVMGFLLESKQSLNASNQ